MVKQNIRKNHGNYDALQVGSATHAEQGLKVATGSAVFDNDAEIGGKQIAVATTGSPASSSTKRFQAGTGTLGAGSDVWVTFGEAFSSSPDSVIATPNASLQDIFIEAGSVNAGSFYAQGETASEDFYYQAIGDA